MAVIAIPGYRQFLSIDNCLYIPATTYDCSDAIPEKVMHTWCTQEVVCSRGLFFPRWKLSPTRSDLPSHPKDPSHLQFFLIFFPYYRYSTPSLSNEKTKQNCSSSMPCHAFYDERVIYFDIDDIFSHIRQFDSRNIYFVLFAASFRVNYLLPNLLLR